LATRQAIVDLGAASVGPNDALAFLLLPAAGNPVFAFACQDQQRFQMSGHPQPQYVWFLGHTPPIPGEPTFPLDRAASAPDVYVVQLIFAQCANYRLQIMKLPIKSLVLDVIYTATAPGDQFAEPFTVIAQ
jgi:hypothetical protein